jgi:hypothetical protein
VTAMTIGGKPWCERCGIDRIPRRHTCPKILGCVVWCSKPAGRAPGVTRMPAPCSGRPVIDVRLVLYPIKRKADGQQRVQGIYVSDIWHPEITHFTLNSAMAASGNPWQIV